MLLTKRIVSPYTPKVINLEELIATAKRADTSIISTLAKSDKDSNSPKSRCVKKVPYNWDADF